MSATGHSAEMTKMDLVIIRGRMSQNNYWHVCDEAYDSVMIFVHGFLSDSVKCWTARSGAYWPDIVADDNRIPPMSIFMGGYHTSFLSSHYGAADCADELFSALSRKGSRGEASVISRGRLVFVCHSLGGVVTRTMLERRADDFRNKTIGICLMASPSLGSKFASVLSPLAHLFRNRAGNQLTFFSAYLEDLDDRFARFLDRRAEGTLWGAEASEHQSQLPVLGRWLGRTVEKHSSARYFASRRTLAGTDHSTIVKPESDKAPGHLFLIDFLAAGPTHLIAPLDVDKNESTRAPSPTDVLFSAYDLALENLYIAREEDGRIARSGAHRNIWVSGPPGIGKTCLLRRFVVMSGHAHTEICLSQCGSSPTRERILREIYESLVIDRGQQPSISGGYAGVIELLLKDSRDTLYVHIDEVSAGNSGEGGAEELLSLLVDLATTCEQRAGVKVKFFVSALTSPVLSSMGAKRSKALEYFDFIGCSKWSNPDLLSLVQLIDKNLRILTDNEIDSQRMVEISQGSPRFVKFISRKILYLESKVSSEDLDKLMCDAARELAA